MRAENLQALVYKQGQAGVTKASVSIVFNNTDKANSPVSYEDHDQITVTRQVGDGSTTAGFQCVCKESSSRCCPILKADVRLHPMLHTP